MARFTRLTIDLRNVENILTARKKIFPAYDAVRISDEMEQKDGERHYSADFPDRPGYEIA